MEVLFPPKDQCFKRIIRIIKKAKHTIHMQCYQLTADPIADALLKAHKRGVKIIIIADKSQINSKYSCIPKLKSLGIQIVIDHKPAIAHNKIIIVDAGYAKATTIGGSYNYTKNAEKRNAENMILYENQPKVAAVFLENWQNRYQQSKHY